MWSCSVIDLTGERIGRLTVISFAGKDKYNHKTWNCICDCGNSVVATTSNLRGTTKSCGCLRRDNITTHGMNESRIYQIWADMKTRVDCPTNPYYCDYGGRGISYDPSWVSFEAFFEDMKDGYSDELTLDRIDVNGNYCKENCRWATASLQNHNKRKQKGCMSNFIGVVYDKRHNVWYARIKNCGRGEHLGTFKTQESAALAYDNASELYYGDRPNKTVREE